MVWRVSSWNAKSWNSWKSWKRWKQEQYKLVTKISHSPLHNMKYLHISYN